jgi:hypothetical protein
MEECWKPIQEFEVYEVSSFGNIRNTLTGRLLKPNTDTRGYFQTALYKNNHKHTFLTHRLVASAFIENTADLKEIDHINRMKTDNRVENLRWVSRSENMFNTNHHMSDMLGIQRRSDRDSFRVVFQMNGKLKYVGSSKSLEGAKDIRDAFLKTDSVVLQEHIPSQNV